MLIIFLISIFASLFAVWGRYKAEFSADGVELIMDYSSLQLLDVDEVDYLKELKENGLTAMAIYPDDIKTILNQGKARLITANELKRLTIITGKINPLLASYPYNKDSAFFIVDDLDYVERLQEHLPLWSEEFDIEYQIDDGQAIVFFKEWGNKYLNLSLGFDKQVIEHIKENDLKLIPRFFNNQLDNTYNWQIMNELSPYAIIFAGSEVTGYSDENKIDLSRTADIMLQNYIVFGMIEPFIAKQKGAESLAYYLDFNMLRVHSIQQKEMDERENYNSDKIIDRYLRAVRERNVRFLYLKPFLREKDDSGAEERTISFISNLSKNLVDSGYNPGSLKTFQKYRSPILLLLLTGLGISVAGIILLEKTMGINFKKYFWVLLVLALLGQIGLLAVGRELFLRKLLALGSAVIFPSLAIITQLLADKQKRWILRFLKASLISLIGAILLSAALAHISFMLKVDQFVGVKISFVLPIVFISIYYFRRYFNLRDNSIISSFFSLLESKIKVKHLLLLFFIALGGVMYIGRTGNNPIIPVPDLEILFRDFLENILYIRPRFKEFLIGHPFFILALGLEEQLSHKLVYFPLLILASIGQINILNTFSHIHTPIIVSIIRSIHGIWLGLIIGVVIVLIVRYLLSIWNNKRGRYHV